MEARGLHSHLFPGRLVKKGLKGGKSLLDSLGHFADNQQPDQESGTHQKQIQADNGDNLLPQLLPGSDAGRLKIIEIDPRPDIPLPVLDPAHVTEFQGVAFLAQLRHHIPEKAAFLPGQSDGFRHDLHPVGID